MEIALWNSNPPDSLLGVCIRVILSTFYANTNKTKPRKPAKNWIRTRAKITDDRSSLSRRYCIKFRTKSMYDNKTADKESAARSTMRPRIRDASHNVPHTDTRRTTLVLFVCTIANPTDVVDVNWKALIHGCGLSIIIQTIISTRLRDRSVFFSFSRRSGERRTRT